MVNIEKTLSRDEVLKILTRNEASKVSFYKVNGEFRDMICTLNQDQLALMALDGEHPHATVGLKEATTETPDYDENQIRVYDIEKKGWRSFLLTNLVGIEGINT